MCAFVNPYVPDPKTLQPLEPPYEILELVPGKPVKMRVLDWKMGQMTIVPRYPGAPPTKTVVAIRIFTDPASKPTFPYYWDITSSRLVYQLAPMLAQGLHEKMALEITRDAPGPRAHYQVRWVPL